MRTWGGLARFAVLAVCVVGFSVELAAERLAFDDTPGGPREWGFRPGAEEVSAVNPPAFSWRPQRNAAAYRLQVASQEAAAGWQVLEYEARSLEMHVHCPPRTLAPGSYRWRVRFVTEAGEESEWSSERRFSVDASAAEFPLPPRGEVLARVPGSHPRLFLRPDELAGLRDLAAGPLRERFEALRAHADRVLADPPPTDDYPPYPAGVRRLSPEWTRQWRAVRPYIDRSLGNAATLAFVWLLSGEEEYGQMARSILMDVAQWDPRGTTSIRYNSEAGMRYAHLFPRAYTWLWELLSDEERQRCLEVMRVRGNELYSRLYPRHLWQPYGSHQNRQFHFLGELALACLGDVDEAADWLWFTLNVFFNTYPVWSDDDGGWHEGVGYWNSYLSLVSVWIDIQRSALEIDGFHKPFFARTGYYPLYAQPPGVPRLTFGDTTGTRNPPNVRRLMTWLSESTGNPYWYDYLQRIGGPTYPGGYLGFMRAARQQAQGELTARSIAELPLARRFEGTGLVYLHTDLTAAENNVQISFKSSPLGKQSHGNEANNSFELYAYGEPLLIRTGTREVHGSPHHREWVWATKSCNSILVDGQGEKSNRAAAVGRIAEFEHTPDFDYVVGSAGEAYEDEVLQEFDRHLLFVRPDLLVVLDDLQAPQPSRFQYLLHAPAEFQITSQEELAVRVGQAGLQIQLLSPADLELSQRDTFDTPLQDPIQLDEYHLTASTREPASRQQFVTLLRPHREGEVPPSGAQLEQSPAGYALRADHRDGQLLVVWRTGPGELSGWGLSSDAAVSAVILDADQQPLRSFAAGGGTVRWNGQPLNPEP